MKQFYLSLLYCLLACSLLGQTPATLDSLQAVVDKGTSATERLSSCLLLLEQLVMSDSAQAEQYISLGKQLAQALDDELALQELQLQRARLFITAKHYEQATALIEEVQAVAARQDWFELLGKCHYEQSTVYTQQHDYAQAIVALKQCITACEQSGNRSLLAQAAYKLGALNYYMKDHPQSLTFCEQSLSTYQALDDQQGMLRALICVGIAQSNLEDYHQSANFYTRALQLAQELQDSTIMASVLTNLGVLHGRQGNLPKAIELYEQSIAIQQAVGNQNSVAILLFNIGGIYQRQRNYSLALSFFRRSLTNYQALGHKQTIALCYSTIGNNFLWQHQEDSAHYYFQKSFDICREMGYRKQMRTTFQEIGKWYTTQGQVPKALNFYYDALDMAEEVQDTLGVAEVHSLIAGLHQQQQHYEEAITYQQQSLETYQSLGQASRVANVKSKMASLFLAAHDYPRAINYALASYQGYQSIQDTCHFIEALLPIGQAYAALQKQDSALYYFTQVLPLAQKCEMAYELSSIFIELGQIYQAQEKIEAAFKAYKRALHYAELDKDYRVIKQAAQALYPLYEAKGQHQQALTTFKLFHTSNDSLFNEANTRKLVEKELEYTYQKEQQQKEAKHQLALERQQWLIYGVIGTCIALIAIAMAVYRNYRNKQQANMQLQAQKAEIEEKNEVLEQQKAALEEIDHVKSRFFANISHELRTPLTLIRGPIETLLASPHRFTTKELQKLQLVIRNTQQLKGLVNDILELSKLESKKVAVHEEEHAIKPLLHRIASNYNSLAQHLGIQYQQSCNNLPNDWLWVDVPKLEKVINNLVSNALKHTPAGGLVHVSAKKVADCLQVQVQDTGTGIAAADLPYIFDRFFQSKQPNTPIQGGTGIGLALAKEFTLLLEGELTVESVEGQGSTFTLTLPYKIAPAAEEIQEDEQEELVNLDHLSFTDEEENNKVWHILIVEDHPDMQNFIHGLLSPRYHVHGASNGKEALAMLAQRHIDLIVSDVMMPEMDGYTLLNHLKENDTYRHIPVVMLTALDSEEHKLQALTIGVDDYLTKPFSPTELLARVHNLLERQQERTNWQAAERDSNFTPILTSRGTNTQEELANPMEISAANIEWIQDVANTIRKELKNDDFSIGKLADQFHLSRRQFQRRITSVTGLSPKKYQQEVALQQAREYLEEGTYSSVKAVAFSVGIARPHRFSQLYEARFGKKPKAYFQ